MSNIFPRSTMSVGPNFEREYVIETVYQDGRSDSMTVVIYADSHKDAYLIAVDKLDHLHDDDVAAVRLHHRGMIIATLAAFDPTSHYRGKPNGWVAQYEPGSMERIVKAEYTSQYVIERNKR